MGSIGNKIFCGDGLIDIQDFSSPERFLFKCVSAMPWHYNVQSTRFPAPHKTIGSYCSWFVLFTRQISLLGAFLLRGNM